MLDHTGIRTSDLERSVRFYERALAPLGYRLLKRIPGAAGFGVPAGAGENRDPGGDFWVGQAEPHAPRTHVAYSAPCSPFMFFLLKSDISIFPKR